IVLSAFINFSVGASAQETIIGRAEYLAHCAPCHGIDGKGNGPQGQKLMTRPVDLTLLARRAGGRFSPEAVYEKIDGRSVVTPHRRESMPVWGCRYDDRPAVRVKKRRLRGFRPKPLESLLNLSCDSEEVIRARIQAVVAYLERIQQK